jgi:hypothetical protein
LSEDDEDRSAAERPISTNAGRAWSTTTAPSSLRAGAVCRGRELGLI